MEIMIKYYLIGSITKRHLYNLINSAFVHHLHKKHTHLTRPLGCISAFANKSV